MRRALILGGTSAIAEHVARRLAARGDALFLVARDEKKLEAVLADLKIRGASKALGHVEDLADLSRQAAVVSAAWDALGGVDTVLLAYGTLSDQAACEQDPALLERELRTNFVSAACLLTLVTQRLQAAGKGTVAVISSVAGDRGRQSNYVYGSAKAALTAFASGLRNRLFASGVRVVTVKPGFVDTPMTAHFKKGALFVGPDTVARGIVRAIDRGTPVVYLPSRWRLIMAVIRAIPERIFMRLKL